MRSLSPISRLPGLIGEPRGERPRPVLAKDGLGHLSGSTPTRASCRRRLCDDVPPAGALPGPARGWNLLPASTWTVQGSCGAAGGWALGTRAGTVEDLTVMLAEFGVERIAWHGRLFTGSGMPAQPGAGA